VEFYKKNEKPAGDGCDYVNFEKVVIMEQKANSIYGIKNNKGRLSCLSWKRKG
jgi:hypothetical protein